MYMYISERVLSRACFLSHTYFPSFMHFHSEVLFLSLSLFRFLFLSFP